jgi:outer membrane biogenesis lipoprotein LolB
MKKLGFVVLGSAALALSACGSKNADQLNEAEAQNVEANVLNDLADNAANAEVEALGAQQQQLDAESNEAPAAVETPSSNATDPKQVEDDVQGM